jgi:hypothetical protein
VAGIVLPAGSLPHDIPEASVDQFGLWTKSRGDSGGKFCANPTLPGRPPMNLLISGIAILVIGALLFWYCLPRGGKTHRLVGTEWEPYVAVAFCAGVAISFSMILSGIIALLSGQ